MKLLNPKNNILKNCPFYLAVVLNTRGFSLVQVMVAIGLMGGLALAMMRMTDNQIKQQKTMEMKAELGDVATIIRQTLSNKNACITTFLGMSPGDNIPSIRMSTNMSLPPFLEVGKKFKTFNVYVKSMNLLTRLEEISHKQRDAALPPISNYNDGFGYGYLKVTFVKQSGAITDENKSRNFYGAKETNLIFPIAGYFYDVEIVQASDQNKLSEACFEKAATKGVTCNGTAGERCSVVPLDEDKNGQTDKITDISGMAPGGFFLAECRYFRDDSPFMDCHMGTAP